VLFAALAVSLPAGRLLLHIVVLVVVPGARGRPAALITRGAVAALGVAVLLPVAVTIPGFALPVPRIPAVPVVSTLPVTLLVSDLQVSDVHGGRALAVRCAALRAVHAGTTSHPAGRALAQRHLLLRWHAGGVVQLLLRALVYPRGGVQHLLVHVATAPVDAALVQTALVLVR
jgi:hypothetical protein